MSLDALNDIDWWLNNVDLCSRSIRRSEPNLILCSDASNEGWGAVVGDESTGGRWFLCEKLSHINALEMKSVEFGLKALCAN